MKNFIAAIVFLSLFDLLGTTFQLSYDTNWPNRADELCSETNYPDVYYKSISSPFSSTHLVGVDSAVLSNGNYLVLAQIYATKNSDATFSNPSRYYLSVIDKTNGNELDNYYITGFLLNKSYELFDIEKIPNQTNSFLIVGRFQSTIYPNPTNYSIFVAKITVNSSNIISVAWTQNLNTSTDTKAGYSIAMHNSEVYIGGYSALSGNVIKADLTSTGLNNVTTIYNCVGFGSNCVVNKIQYDEDLAALLIGGGYSYSRFISLNNIVSGSVAFLYKMNSSGQILSSYTNNGIYSDHLRMTDFAYNYASDMLLFIETENNVMQMYDVNHPLNTSSTTFTRHSRSIDTFYHSSSNAAVFADMDNLYTYLRVDANLDGDFTDSVDTDVSDGHSVWMCNGVLKGSAIENPHIRIIDNNKLLSVGSVVEPDNTYDKLFIQKRFYN